MKFLNLSNEIERLGAFTLIDSSDLLFLLYFTRMNFKGILLSDVYEPMRDMRKAHD